MKKKIFPFIIYLLLVVVCPTESNNSMDILMRQFSNNVENLWGLNEILIVGPKDYVNYTDQYETRSYTNFKSGTITVENISNINQIVRLRRAIIRVLLMGSNFNFIDPYFGFSNFFFKKQTFFHKRILDNKGNPIRWRWQAANFADYLLQHRLQIRHSSFRQILSITIKLIPNNIDKRAYNYLSIVSKASHKYGIDQSLILTIIQIESDFNPYAVSNSNALGLMQVIQRSAGRDVFKMRGKWGHPSRSYLLNPKNNIDIGTAYLAILKNSYLRSIINPISKKYALIAAYNGGVGNVLRIFSHDSNRAFQIINSMHPDDVYQMLTNYHPLIESRRYLHKVCSLQKKY